MRMSHFSPNQSWVIWQALAFGLRDQLVWLSDSSTYFWVSLSLVSHHLLQRALLESQYSCLHIFIGVFMHLTWLWFWVRVSKTFPAVFWLHSNSELFVTYAKWHQLWSRQQGAPNWKSQCRQNLKLVSIKVVLLCLIRLPRSSTVI